MSIIIQYDIKSLCVRHEYYYTVRYGTTGVLLCSTLCVRHWVLLYSTARHEYYYTVRYNISLRPTWVLIVEYVIISFCVRHDYYSVYDTVRHEYYYIVRYNISLRPTQVLIVDEKSAVMFKGVRNSFIETYFIYRVYNKTIYVTVTVNCDHSHKSLASTKHRTITRMMNSTL